MHKRVILVICSIALLISGCATVGTVKGAAAGNIIYTDASEDMAFNASCEALGKLKYKIKVKDRDNLFIEGSYFNPLTGYSPVVAQIDIVKETSGVKITYGVDQPGTIKALDITGYYPRLANNIYKEIAKILKNKGYKAQAK